MYSNKIAPINQDLSIVKGATKTYEMQFQQNGAPVDLTGWTVFFTVKTKMSDLDANAIISKTITTFENGTAGIALISLLTTDTDITPKSYYYDITIQTAETPVSRAVILRGRLTIEKTTTRREN